MRIGIGQHPEGRGQQTVSGEHRRRLVELLVAGRAAAAQIAVVHRRQIVMHERVGVDHLDRRRDLQGATPRHPEKTRARQHEKRAQPFAGRQSRVAHRVIDPRLEAGRHDQQPLERGIGQLGGLVQSASGKKSGRTTASQSSFAGSAVTAPSGPITIRSTLCCASLSFLSQCRFSCAPRS